MERDRFEPPFPRRQLVGAFLLAITGGLVVVATADAGPRGIALAGFAAAATGILGGIRLIQRHLLGIFNPRWTRIADVAVVAFGLGLLLAFVSDRAASRAAGIAAAVSFKIAVALIFTSFALCALGFLSQLRSAIRKR